MLNKKNIFCVESHVGKHHEINKNFNADVVSFTFAPLISKNSILNETDFSNLLPMQLSNIRINGILIDTSLFFQMIIRKIYSFVFIGTDLDFEGNAMARILQDYCINNGYSTLNIIRIPLTNDGFCFVSSFWSNKIMKRYIEYKKDEQDFIQLSKRINGSFGIGRRNILLINELLNPPICVENINSSGTSSVTYIFKKRIKEK